MKSMRLILVVIMSLSFLVSAMTESEYDLSIKVTRLSDRAIILSTEDGSGPQVALASSMGIVVMSTLWSPGIASEYRDILEKEFGRSDFAYAINNWDRLDVVGGNSAYDDAIIIGHERCRENLIRRQESLDRHLQELIDMWQWKAGLSQERLASYDPASEDAASERVWLAYCRRIADDLSKGYSLVLPTLTFGDRLTLDLGDMTLKLYYFGRASFESGILMHVPEEKLLLTDFLFQGHHLAPTPNRSMAELDVPIWLDVLDTVLADENSVERVVGGPSEIHSREWLVARRDYIRQLWDEVSAACEAGLDLETIRDRLSLETKFPYIRQWDIYTNDGPEWTEQEHSRNIRLFWAQHQTFAAHVVQKTLAESGIEAAVQKYYELQSGSDNQIHFDENSFNALGYTLLGEGKIDEAVEILKLNVEAYPDSWNVYDSLGEAYMNNGNTKLAVENYEKSLEINPENTNAVEMLERLKKE
ncbi:MAG: tetratricopeptide repeat protein [Gemmatimonadota bacterium]|nr:MAG: tetratricopeptide repeat protein [Gemmatimonadota bacterium]